MDIKFTYQNTIPLEEVERLFFESTSVNDLPDMIDTAMGDPNSDIGIIFQHGFIGSPIDFFYIANHFADKYRILIPLLPGHGKTAREMHGVDHTLWIKKMEKSIEFMKSERENRKIFLVGHSLGGSISMINASNSDDITAIVTLSSPVKLNSSKRRSALIMGKLLGFLYIPYSEFIFHDKRLYDNPYIHYLNKNFAKVSISTLRQVMLLIDKAFASLNNIKIPYLIIHAEKDETVPYYNTDIIYNNISSVDKKIIKLEESYHIVVADTDKDKVVIELKSFIEQNS